MDKRTLADHAYTVLEERFVKGIYMPNEKLSENTLCNELDMSRTPLRRALSWLANENYLECVDKKGIIVKGFTIKEIQDRYSLLFLLERESIFHLLNNKVTIPFDLLEKEIAIQIAAKEANDYYTYLTAYHNFKEHLFRASGNTAIEKTAKILRKDLIRMGMVLWRKTQNRPHYSTIAQNEKIFTLLQQKDVQSIEQFLSEVDMLSKEYFSKIED